MNWDAPETLRITCARGLAPYLRDELRALGFDPSEVRETGVEVVGSLNDALRLNLQLRTAFHVLYHLDTFACDSGDDLYFGVNALPWEEWIPADEYLSVVSRVNHHSVDNSMWPNLRTKDAIVDRIQSEVGRRPDSGPTRDNVVVTLHWSGREASIFLDTSGQKLSDRGYRKRPHTAPMRESLAAGVLMKIGYDGSGPLVNPMCGSGTLAIEAALIGSGRAPGLLRGAYGARHLVGFEKEAWEALRAELRAAKGGRPAPIVASDHDPQAIEAARHNAKTAGVDDLIEFQVCDFAETRIPEGEGGKVLLNLQYGIRLGEGDMAELEQTYNQIGDFFKQRCQGYTGWLFTGNRDLLKCVGLRASRKIPFWNGEIECRLARFLLFKGKHTADPEAG